MKNTLFNDEIEGYTNRSNIRVYIFLGVLFVSFVFIGWLVSTLGGLADVMIEVV